MPLNGVTRREFGFSICRGPGYGNGNFTCVGFFIVTAQLNVGKGKKKEFFGAFLTALVLSM